MTAKINALWGRNRMKVRPILAMIGAVLAAAVPISAQNRLANSGFESALAPWTSLGSTAPDPAGSGSASWTVARNLDNLPGSGAADTTLTGVA